MDRIAQLVVQRVERAAFREVTALPQSPRGTNGYGSTGTSQRAGSHSRESASSVRTSQQGQASPKTRHRCPVAPRTSTRQRFWPGATESIAALGPYDADDAPDDGWVRLDLGSLRLPVPEGAQLQVEVDRSGPVRAVHLITGARSVHHHRVRRSPQRRVVARGCPGAGDQTASRWRPGRAGPGEWGEEIEAVTEQGVLAVPGGRRAAVDAPRCRGRRRGAFRRSYRVAARPCPADCGGPWFRTAAGDAARCRCNCPDHWASNSSRRPPSWSTLPPMAAEGSDCRPTETTTWDRPRDARTTDGRHRPWSSG